jgi:hypothetical protein
MSTPAGANIPDMGAINEVADTAVGPDLEDTVQNVKSGYQKGKAIGTGLWGAPGSSGSRSGEFSTGFLNARSGMDSPGLKAFA